MVRCTWFDTSRILRQVIDDEGSLNFWLYAYTSGVVPNLFFARSSGMNSLQPRPTISVGLQYLLGVLLPTPLSLRLENGDAMVAYSPQRVLRIFGFDYGVAC